MSFVSRSLSIIALAGVVAVSGCKQEQVLYETDQASTTGPGGGLGMPMAQQLPGGAGSLQFERPPERSLLSLDQLKTHTVEGIEIAIPRDWTFRASTAPMRAAEVSANGVDITVFYFGQGQGGDAEANIRRWLNQVQLAAGWEPSLYQQRSNGLVVTEVIARGRYTPTAMGPAAPAPEPIADAILHGVVVEGGPKGSVFIRATGPIRAIEAARPGLETMVQLLRPVVTE